MSKAGRTAGKVFNKVNPVEALREVLTAYVDYAKVKQVQTTRRREIAANLETDLLRIRAQQRLVLDYLDKSFAERSSLFREQFRLADEALGRGDVESLAVLVGGIVELAKQSPLSALADFARVQAALKDGDTEWSV